MLSNLYKSHVLDNIKIVQSLVIKSEAAIDSSARYLKSFGIIEGDDPRTWKYYLNLSGQYHSTDTPMVVISADTKTSIIFDKTILTSHPLTVAEYQRGTVLRSELERKYPKQLDLIERILYPIDIEVAIAAKDFEILYYDKRTIAANETNLIPNLQKWIHRFSKRWFNRDYTIVDTLYTADFMAKLFLLMVTEIANIRLANSKTKYVSQWHVWVYLSGFYGLGDYREYVTLEQSLYLYKNIAKIRKNMGSNSILKDLVENILHPVYLEAYRFDMYKLENKFIEERKFRPRFNKALLYDENIEVDEVSMIESREMMELTKDIALFNPTNIDERSVELEQGVNNSIDNTRASKAIEISQVEGPVGTFANMTELRMTYWMYLSAKGLYNSAVRISIPGKVEMNLSPLNCLIMLIYSLERSKGKAAHEIASINPDYYQSTSSYNDDGVWPNILIEDGKAVYPTNVDDFVQYGKIPFIQVSHVIPDTYRDRSDIVKLLDPEHVYVDGATDLLYQDLVGLREVTSVTELGDFCDSIALQQFKFIRATSAHAKTGLGESLIDTAASALLENRFMHIATYGKTWDEWATEIEFDDSGLEPDDFESIAFSCLQGAAGIDTTHRTMPEAQLAMIEIVDLLTSYGLIVLKGKALNAADRLDWFDMIVDRTGDEQHSTYHVSSSGIGLERQGDVTVTTVDGVGIRPVSFDEVIGFLNEDTIDIPVGLEIDSLGSQQSHSVVGLADLAVTNINITHEDDNGVSI